MRTRDNEVKITVDDDNLRWMTVKDLREGNKTVIDHYVTIIGCIPAVDL